MATWSKTWESANRALTRAWVGASVRMRRLARSEAGQGTTEYAILVGVLVVIAILAIAAFRGRLSELWDAIIEGINGL